MLQRPLILSRDSKTGGVWASPVAQVKKLSAVQEMRVPYLGQEDPWRKKCQPTTLFFPGKSHGQRRQAGNSPWDHKEPDTI